ncbi:hypothetical protein ACUF3I_003964 [Proteus mirabilis]
MKTIEEIRREWLNMLIEQHKTIANLNIALGRAKTDATLSQIRNKAIDSKSGNPRNMGSPLAREIEEKLGLEIGTLDHTPCKTDKSHRNNSFLEAYESADDAIKSIIDFILHKETSTPIPQWVDTDAKAHADSLELKSRKWFANNKSNKNKIKTRA